MNDATMERQLDAKQRQRLAELSDELISGGLGLPCASKANVHKRWIDRALKARPDLFNQFVSVLSVDGDPADVISNLRKDNRQNFMDFWFIIAGAYLMNPSVCRLLGLPGNAPKKQPALPDESDHYLEDGLLDSVISRGSIYRPTPDH
jgi:hypothetical protein